MVILKVIRPVRLRGEILKSDDIFKMENGEQLIARGYVRRLNNEETRAILDSYTEYAEKIFHGEKSDTQKRSEKDEQGKLF